MGWIIRRDVALRVSFSHMLRLYRKNNNKKSDIRAYLLEKQGITAKIRQYPQQIEFQNYSLAIYLIRAYNRKLD